MMFAEIIGVEFAHSPSDGFAYIRDTFANPVYVVLYVIWIVAIWLHLSHGFWSAMHTLGIMVRFGLSVGKLSAWYILPS